MKIGNLPWVAAEREPDKVAIIDGDLRKTWEEWNNDICHIAGGFSEIGLLRGDRCVCIMPNSYEMATTYFACHLLGLVFIPVNWRLTRHEFHYVLSDAQASVVLFDEVALPNVRSVINNVSIKRVVSTAVSSKEIKFVDLLDSPAAKPKVNILDSDTCLMLYTSGTTGRPKGVLRSHAAEKLAAIACAAQLRYLSGEKSLGVMPLFHTMGIRVLLMTALVAGTWVNMRRFDAPFAVRLIERESISALFLVPTMYHDLLKTKEIKTTNISSVRNLAYAGMAMNRTLEKQVAETFSPEVFANYYGSSEIFTFSYCDDLTTKPGSAGWAGMGQVLRVVRADQDATVGGNEIVAQGEIGEVVATMESGEAFSGYWRRPDADSKAIRDGWYFTGDLGYFDEDGALFLCGRVDDMIISGGENIHPEEIENILLSSEFVDLAAVVGEHDDRWGQIVVAYVQSASAAANSTLLDTHCKSSVLADFKRPRKYVFVDKIPVSASGKLMRRLLRDGDYKIS